MVARERGAGFSNRRPCHFGRIPPVSPRPLYFPFGPTIVDGKPAPQTLEELSRQADTRFMGASFKLNNLAFDSDRLVRRTKEDKSQLQTLYARERELKTRAAALPKALREARGQCARPDGCV